MICSGDTALDLALLNSRHKMVDLLHAHGVRCLHIRHRRCLHIRHRVPLNREVRNAACRASATTSATSTPQLTPPTNSKTRCLSACTLACCLNQNSCAECPPRFPYLYISATICVLIVMMQRACRRPGVQHVSAREGPLTQPKATLAALTASRCYMLCSQATINE
jgi:hypothetical protein